MQKLKFFPFFLKSIFNRFLKLILVCFLLKIFVNIYFAPSKQIFPKKLIELAKTPTHFYNIDNVALPPKGFLVWSENCRIPRIEIFSKDLTEKFLPLETAKCADKEPFVQKFYDSKHHQYRLLINANRKEISDFICCYKEIIYLEKSEFYWVLPCINFSNNFLVPKHIEYGITVKCMLSNLTFYRDAFFFFQQKMHVIEDFSADFKEKIKTNLGIFLIGIDSLSQFSFRQTMPRTFAFLRRNRWFELSGYNKVDHNTFPNVMALLSGLNRTGIEEHCQGYNINYLDDCHLIFEKFSKYGYLTAYTEDQSYLNTFKGGFRKPPTDFYMMPMMELFEKENGVKIGGDIDITKCIAERITATLVFDDLSEFILRNNKSRKFWVSWINSFTHEDTFRATYFDEHMLNYMEKWKRHGFFQNNIFIFFSDHGMRWGKLFQYTNKFYESRLPIMFLWLPPNIREKHPEFVYALTVNKNRLTSPYDIFLTLQQLLSLSIATNETFQMPEGCATCQSVLKPISENRTCKDAGIPIHWCTCEPYFPVNIESDLLIDIVNLVVENVNKFLHKSYKSQCEELKLLKVKKAEAKSYSFKSKSEDYKKLNLPALDPYNEGLLFRVEFTTVPHNMEYEASFVYFKNNHDITFDIHDISILSLYGEFSKCVKDVVGKQFCMCIKN